MNWTLLLLWTESFALPHLMLQDVAGSLWAVLVFAVALFAPGYMVGFGTGIFGFRQLSFSEQSLLAVAYSFLVAPIAAHLVGRVAGLHGVVAVLAIAGLICVGLLLIQRRRLHLSKRQLRIVLLIGVGWTVLVLLLLVDFQTTQRMYFSVVMADQSYRIAFTSAVLRTGVPPANPLYFAGTFAPMRYYYFWYVLCAAVAQLAHTSARQAFIASSVWAGFGLIAVTWQFTTQFFSWSSRQRWLTIALLLVGGADLIPALGQALLQPALNGDPEWWSVDPIDSWPDSLLWVPHHVASVLCCLMAFLLLWRSCQLQHGTSRDRWWASVLAAFGFASACGLSVYVAFGFALLMAAWMLWLALRREPASTTFARFSLSAALLSSLLLLPFLLELAAGNGSHAPSVSAVRSKSGVFVLSVRRMIDSGLLTNLPIFSTLNRTHPMVLDQTLRLLLLFPGLAMELGLYGAVLVLVLRHRGRFLQGAEGAARRSALFFTITGLVLTMFVSSAVITNNDFGYRAVMLPQFFLLLLTADLCGSWWLPGRPHAVPSTPFSRKLLASLAGLGIAGMVYWAVLLRAWLPIETLSPQHGFASLPEDEFQIRQAFASLDHLVPRQAVVAFRPIDPTPDRQGEVMAPNEFYQRMLVMDSNRQLLNAEGKCAVHFGGDPDRCQAIQRQTAVLYTLPSPGGDWARNYCQTFGVSYLALSAWDPNWSARSGWPATLPVIAAQPRILLLGCGTL